jgi:hypothetical protein
VLPLIIAVSEEYSSSIFKVHYQLHFLLLAASVMAIGPVRSSEISTQFYQTARRDIPVDRGAGRSFN